MQEETVCFTILSLQRFWLHFAQKNIDYMAVSQTHCQLQTFVNK